MTECAVVGIGSADRGDDAIGLLVADRVRELGPAGVTVVPVASPMELLEVFERYDDVVVVDAVRSGADAGTVTVTLVDGPLPTRSGGGGTHGLGVAEAVELARVLDRLPTRLVIVGVELAQMTLGEESTDSVNQSVDRALTAVLRAAVEGAVFPRK